jgi:centrosomal protein CEP76
VIEKEIELEMELNQHLEFYRKDRSLDCVFDDSLENLLGQSLWSIETEKLYQTNKSCFTDDFQEGVKRSMPEGHVFKGFPVCYNHMNVGRMFSNMCRIRQCKDIFSTRGDCVRMALRVKIFPYSDGVLACWILVGSRSLP